MDDLHLDTADPHLMRPDQYHEQLMKLKLENSGLHDQIGRQEVELNKLKVQLGSFREERDKLKRRVSKKLPKNELFVYKLIFSHMLPVYLSVNLY